MIDRLAGLPPPGDPPPEKSCHSIAMVMITADTGFIKISVPEPGAVTR